MSLNKQEEIIVIYVCLSVMFSGEFISTTGKLKNMPDHGGSHIFSLLVVDINPSVIPQISFSREYISPRHI